MKTIIVLMAVMASLGGERALAWEKDVHYGLTLWLSLQAGFSKEDAMEIARLTQAEDEGHVTPATDMQTLALMFGDESASRTVSRKHFPTSGKMNVKPKLRPVEAGGPAAHFLLDA